MGQRSWIRIQRPSKAFYFNVYEHHSGPYFIDELRDQIRRLMEPDVRYELSEETLALHTGASYDARCWLGDVSTLPDEPAVKVDFDSGTVTIGDIWAGSIKEFADSYTKWEYGECTYDQIRLNPDDPSEVDE